MDLKIEDGRRRVGKGFLPAQNLEAENSSQFLSHLHSRVPCALSSSVQHERSKLQQININNDNLLFSTKRREVRWVSQCSVERQKCAVEKVWETSQPQLTPVATSCA